MKLKSFSFLSAFLMLPLLIITASCGQQAEQAVPADLAADTVAVAVVETPDLTVEAPLIRVGYVKQDHHAALFVAALRGEAMSAEYPVYLAPLGEEYYALVENGVKVAEIQLIQSEGAINVPNNMVAGLFDVGLGGVAAFMSSADQGSGIRMISALHNRGDMLVVAAGNETVQDWDTFLAWVNSSEEPVTVGFKGPQSVALIIFESALTEAGVAWSMQSSPVEGSRILLYNAQSEANLNPAIENGTIDAYVSNNPACAMAEHNGIGRCVAELSDLPPGEFANHPCCVVAATETAIATNPTEIASLLRLLDAATDYIEKNPEDAAAASAEMLGTPVEVELVSMATSGYDMHVTEAWKTDMKVVLDYMRSLNAFTGPLATDDPAANAPLLYDFSLLEARR